jgi:hypothetical protein
VAHIRRTAGQTRGLGRKPFRRDDRDWLYRDATSHLLDAASDFFASKWWEMHGADFRLDQGAEGTCVGHALTNNFLAKPRPHVMYPQFETVETSHQYARAAYLAFTGDTSYQQGANMRDAVDWALREGLVAAYYRCTSVPEITDAILGTGPVFFASSWYRSMFSPYSGNDNEYVRVDPSSGYAGGHAYLLTGVDLEPTAGPPFVRMENSWGADWGRNGTARITLDDLAILYDGDAWVLTEEKF